MSIFTNMYKIHKNIETIDTSLINKKIINRGVLYEGDFDLVSSKRSANEDKRSRPLAAAILGLNNTCLPLPDNLKFHDCWTDADAQEVYITEKPKSYLILEKQGQGAYSLGEALSKKLNCIHLCPKNIILDEIDQNSSTGKCLDFNMRHNNVCKFDVIFSILERKLQSAVVKHRGFVISGFPLITTKRTKEYQTNTLKSEEALQFADDFLFDLIYNLKRKKPKTKISSPHSSVSTELHLSPEEEEIEEEQQEEDEKGEEEEERVELPKFLLDTCSDLIYSTKTPYKTLKSVLLMQIQKIFNLQPDIIICISTPDKDTITKRSRKFMNYTTCSKTFNIFTINAGLELRWPTQYNYSDYKKPFDTHKFNPKYNCKQPMNFSDSIINQICNFKNHIFTFLEKKLKEYNPELVIKLDGRMPVHQLVHHTLERLLMLPIKHVLIPEPLYLEDPPEDIEEFWTTAEELNIIKSGNINFNRYASFWFNRCPVELQKRRSIQGKPKFGVTFFKHVYLLSSLDNMISFCKNPRPYLKLQYLEPTCRIIITGTKTSGKTLVANCLSWIFDCPVICYTQFLNIQRQNKYHNFSKTILSEIIATIEDKRLEKWQHIELERVSKLNTWFNTVFSILKDYIPLLKEKLSQIEEENLEEEPSYLNNYHTIREQLIFLPILDDLEQCQGALKNQNLIKYAPLELRTETAKPSTPLLGDEDVSIEISSYITANELQKEIEPTIDELMNEFIKIIQDLDSISLESAGIYGKFIIDGFPSNPEFWEYLNETKLLPDYTIAIFENREIDIDIVQHYENIEKSVKNYHERYLLSTDPLIQTKLLSKKPIDTSYLDMQIIVDDIVTNGLSDHLENNTETEKNNAELIQTFTEALEKFREDWEPIKSKLDENFKLSIEVEIEEKNDIQIVDEILLKIRKGYFKPCIVNEDSGGDDEDDDNDTPKNLLVYNEARNLNETYNYCPISFYDYGVLWEGKSELSVTFENRNYYFSKEECSEKFQQDITKYQFKNMPLKTIPALRICIVGGTGTGKTSVSKKLARELGLLHVDFEDYINNFVVPRHFKKVGWKYENTFTDTQIDEETAEFLVDEENPNLLSDILSNELELRRMLKNYFEHGTPLLPALMQKIIKDIWFKNPFKFTGIVLDGFPKLPTDVTDMTTCFCIPDLVIYLEGNSETTVDRLSTKYLKIWKTQLNEAKIKAADIFQKEKNEWMNFITMKVVIKLIIDDLIANVIVDVDEPDKTQSAQSTIFDADPAGLSQVDANLFETFNDFVEQNPEPVDQAEWEKTDEVLERINSRLESIFETDDENLQALNDTLAEQQIKVISIQGTKSFDKVFRTILLKISYLRNRCESLLEQTYIINCDIAEMLLSQGIILMSKFYRMCPVFIFENRQAILNPYNLSKSKGKIFPVIHRANIYFISSEKNVMKFRKNPLLYITNKAIELYRPYPLRISVIGPPKSGKSKLAARLANQYGLVCVSKGMALRQMLEKFHWTEVGSKAITQLHAGECIDNEFIIKAVFTVLMDHRTMTNGFVLDGFPETPYEATELSRDGLFPTIVFDIQSDLEATIIRNSQSEVYLDILKRKPPYSIPFIRNRYSSWSKTSQRIRDWIHQDTQNIYFLNGNNSKWYCCVNANQIIESVIPKIHQYFHAKDRIVCVGFFGISNEDFHKQMSVYKNLCPLCLRKKYYRHCDFPPDKKGLIQYKDKFYWICPKHLDYVFKYPTILDYENIKIPDLPAIVKHIDISLLIENGICLVTYAENLPRQKIVSGKNEFAASYRGKFYLFCDVKCLEKFLAQPYMYYDITVFKEMKIFPKLSINQLPDLGYLEQTLGNVMTEACCAVNVIRPKYPGLTARISALIYIALYLKTHNLKEDKCILTQYKKALNIFEIRSKLILDIGLSLRSRDNPFANYPKCCGNKTLKEISCDTKMSKSVISSTLSTDSEINKLH